MEESKQVPELTEEEIKIYVDELIQDGSILPHEKSWNIEMCKRIKSRSDEYWKQESNKLVSIAYDRGRSAGVDWVECHHVLELKQRIADLERRLEETLKTAVNAIYFNDRSDYLRALYSISNLIAGEKSGDINELFKELNK